MIHLTALLLLISFFNVPTNNRSEIKGAWQSDEGVYVFTDRYFAYTAYSETEFKYTYGGSWEISGESLNLNYEFNTKDDNLVGTKSQVKFSQKNNSLKIDDQSCRRVDDGTPGKLQGAWLFSNRIRNGELGTPRSADNPRKTMKILSGTRFQWIAYNTETRQFMGTGGGTYTTTDGKYTENIDFFSRDNSRVGASLVFDFEIKNNDWHHQGFSSKGDPIYEIWSSRE